MGCNGSKNAFVPSRADLYASDMSRTATEPDVFKGSTRDFHREYVLGRKLGEGSFGAVYCASTAGRHEEDVAVKVVDPRAKDDDGRRLSTIDRVIQRTIEREVAILQTLPKSDNIVQFHGLFVSAGFVYMVMEKCSTGLLSILERVPNLTESTFKPMFRDMLSGIAACHAVGIVHRDVKADNFLVMTRASTSSFCVKLSDFGLAGRVSTPEAVELMGVFGTPPYMAPEMLDKSALYTAKVDVWAFGVLAYALLFGTWPYTPSELTGTAMKVAIMSGSPAPRFRGRVGLAPISETCTAWVQALLRRSVGDRFSAEQALKHRNFTKPWSTQASLVQTLGAAKRVGAFELPGRTSKAPSDLDKLLVELNLKHHPRQDGDARACMLSEGSTAIGSDSTSRSR